MKNIGRCLIIVMMLMGLQVYAQQQNQQQQQAPQIVIPQHPAGPHPQQRHEIDAKRTGTNMNSDDALPRSREFLRIDSTYYVGWLYEGAYKYNHAADYLGFKNAAAPLERALAVIERDYRYDLGKRSPELINYFQSIPRQTDYAQIVQYLNSCYQNTEDVEKSYALLRRVVKWNFQVDFYEVYNQLAWLTHRNRFYTKAKYRFLGNSIEENEALANRYLDTAMRRLAYNKQYNAHIPFPPTVWTDMKLGVYHYRCILYSYALKIDSAQQFFDAMRDTKYFPHNNYATFRMVCGDFREAEREYKIASGVDAADKRLQEWAYYSSILNIYKGYAKRGELAMKDMIQNVGSTPGFGWYNIALARCLFYDGQVSESDRYADKAAEFKELHIGTTLGQSHYDFAVQLNQLMVKESEWEMQRFEHRNWWYNLGVLSRMSTITAEHYLQEFLIINQFAQNPERGQVIYRLFSDESVITWDEVWYLIHDFSTQFFLKKFEEEAANDPRKNIRKYFKLFVARMKMKNGDYTDAQNMLTGILRDTTVDEQYEKLFVARVYQSLAACADEKKDDKLKAEWLYRLYQTYPQLMPFSGMRPNMQMIVSGTPDKDVVERLKDCNINWTAGEVVAPRAYLKFYTAGKTKLVEYSVVDAGGNYLVPVQKFSYTDPKNGGISIAYRLFGVGGLADRGEGDVEVAMK